MFSRATSNGFVRMLGEPKFWSQLRCSRGYALYLDAPLKADRPQPNTKPYLVFMGLHPSSPIASRTVFTVAKIPKGDKTIPLRHDPSVRICEDHIKLLTPYVGSALLAKEAMVYSMTRNTYGFVAYLTEGQAAAIGKNPRVIQAYPHVGMTLPVQEDDWVKYNYGVDVDTDECSDSDNKGDEGFVPNPSKCVTSRDYDVVAGVPSYRYIAEDERMKEAQVASGREMNSSTSFAGK